VLVPSASSSLAAKLAPRKSSRPSWRARIRSFVLRIRAQEHS
jgi:hypothetical protein